MHFAPSLWGGFRREGENMSTEDDNKAGLVPSQGAALSRSGATSLIRRGTQDLIAKAEAEQWLKKGKEFAASSPRAQV